MAVVERWDESALFPGPLSLLVNKPSDNDWPRLAVAYLPGEEYSVDILADDGTTLAGVVRLRLAAIGGLATAATTIDAPDILARVRQITATIPALSLPSVSIRKSRLLGAGMGGRGSPSSGRRNTVR